MANSNTSLNGYEFGRSPRTTAPFWGGSSEGAAIDDTGIYTDKTWSSKKISDELAEKADTSDLANYAKVTSVYTKTQTYTKEEVDELLSHIEPSVDAYTKTQTDGLLADKADKATTYTKAQVDALISDIPAIDSYTKAQTDALLETKADATAVYTKSQTYTKSEVDSLISDIPAIDAYTKSQTDNLLADKADKSDTYTKAQVNNLIPDVSGLATKTELTTGLATKADESELASYAKTTSVYTKSQTYTKSEVDALIADKADAADLADYAKTTSVYTKSQTYTKTEVDDLISQAGGGGAEIDDTTVAANKVWSSNKTRAELLKASGLRYTSYLSTDVSLIRAKASGSATSTRNAMTEQFSADYQYSLTNGTVTVQIMYADGSSGQSYTINLTDIPWNDVASADHSTNYPSDNSRWKTIVATEDIFEICIGGNVSGSSGYYYPYIFVRVPKGTYTASISLSANLGDNKWAKAGSVSVINGYATDPTVPLFTKDITTMVSNSTSAFSILDSVFYEDIIPTFKRDIDTIMKFNKMVIECTKVDFNGNTIKFKSNWNIKNIKVTRPTSSSSNMSFSSFILEYDRHDGTKWVFNYPLGMTKISYNIPTNNGNITGSKADDSSTTLDMVLFGQSDYYDSWSLKFYQ